MQRQCAEMGLCAPNNHKCMLRGKRCLKIWYKRQLIPLETKFCLQNSSKAKFIPLFCSLVSLCGVTTWNTVKYLFLFTSENSRLASTYVTDVVSLFRFAGCCGGTPWSKLHAHCCQRCCFGTHYCRDYLARLLVKIGSRCTAGQLGKKISKILLEANF